MGYSEFQIRIFLPLLLVAKRLATRAFVSDHRDNVARVLLFRKAPNRKIVASP